VIFHTGTYVFPLINATVVGLEILGDYTEPGTRNVGNLEAVLSGYNAPLAMQVRNLRERKAELTLQHPISVPSKRTSVSS
jgi:hypothetical protein